LLRVARTARIYGDVAAAGPGEGDAPYDEQQQYTPDDDWNTSSHAPHYVDIVRVDG